MSGQLVGVSQVAGGTPFNNAATPYTATNVQDALAEIFGIIAASAGINFSYKIINVGTSLTIPAGQQMAVHGQIESIDGELIIDGELVII